MRKGDCHTHTLGDFYVLIQVKH